MVVRFRPVGDTPKEQPQPARENLAEIVEFRARLIKPMGDQTVTDTPSEDRVGGRAGRDKPGGHPWVAAEAPERGPGRLSGAVIPLRRASELIPTAEPSEGWGSVTTRETWQNPEVTVDPAADRSSPASQSAPLQRRRDRVAASISEERPLGDPKEQGLKKLARRAQTVRELERYLRGLGHEEDTVQLVISDFLDHGYLDDAELARAQCLHLRERKRASNQVITRTLSDRGVDRALIQEALAVLDPEGESEDEVLRQAAYDRARRLASLDRVTAERRLLGFLARRGWGGAAARDVARAALDEAGI